METISNETRAVRAASALDAHKRMLGESGPSGTDEDVIDLLTDLRHYCKAQGISFRSSVNMSEIHFNEEAKTR